jgi:hypothetical protein
MLQNVRKRVSLWSEVQPYYLDEKSGPGKSKESRSTEAVLNAFVLASEDRRDGHLSPLTRKAFDAAWALQIQSGPKAGAWDWQVFHLAPWESSESQYAGASWMALAVGWAPDHYRTDRRIKDRLQSLRAYLRREYPNQTLLNQVGVLWASATMDGLLTKAEKTKLTSAILLRQAKDGGWSTPALGNWDRLDHTAQETESDGLATALVSLAIQSANTRQSQDAHERGLSWLRTHQDAGQGSWHAISLNKRRDPTSDVGRFMSDAATGYAVLALQSSRK